MKSVIKNLDEMNDWVGEFCRTLSPNETATVIALSGDLGAGKTTFAQLFGAQLGIDETITSPTFVIQKEYNTQQHDWIQKMIHIDAYRLERKEDLEYLGWNENIQDPNTVIVIEWPEMVQGISMPKSVIQLHISINNDHSRTINIK